jgi:DNA-binding XRE family transcriptional regulator
LPSPEFSSSLKLRKSSLLILPVSLIVNWKFELEEIIKNPEEHLLVADLVTGATIASLRSDLSMTQAQFASLIGVSISTINNWEKNKGALKLQARTRKALTEAIRE